MKFLRGPECRLKSPTNWGTLCVLLMVALLLYRDPFVLLWWPQKPAEETSTPPLPLDMASDSIDDMFDGCYSRAASIIDLFGVFEWHFNRNFSLAWAISERNAQKPAHKQLKDDHAIALHTFTKVRNVRKEFNEAVRTEKQKYSTHGFRFHYLYFYLTNTIQVLRQNKTGCRAAYFRTRSHFERNVVNKEMRFGAFIWAAMSKESMSSNGDVSCFEIESCFGADITHYSALRKAGQVLIPPYEVFQITHVLSDDPWCSVVYKLQSTKTPKTDLNCKLDERELENYVEGDLTSWSVSSRVWTMSACGALLILISAVLIKHRQMRFLAVVLGGLLLWIVLLVGLRFLTRE
ncbi:ecto-ADP-ribosyltransferase 4-like [Halichoeres trimaculatus]|uniref:ecto-ADP-ribosyltransferase 4-like n=1 Tax=Halichoeres trimaculatus TaxID=147232 RepID=UPI003D9E1568